MADPFKSQNQKIESQKPQFTVNLRKVEKPQGNGSRDLKNIFVLNYIKNLLRDFEKTVRE